MMKKILFFAVLLVCFLTSCSKDTFETVVKATPYNVGFSLNKELPYCVTVQAESKDANGQFVFSSNNDKAVFDTFQDAIKDSSFVLIGIFEGEIITARKLGKK